MTATSAGDAAMIIASGREKDLPGSRWIGHLGRVISVRSNDEAILNALSAFYLPYYALTPGPPPRRPDLTLSLIVYDHPAPPAPPADMRIYRTKPRTCRDVNGWRIMQRDDADIVVALDRDHIRVLIVGSSPAAVELQARVLFRDQILQRLECAAGSVIFHAAAVAHGDSGMAIMGARNSGKTTALLTLLGTGAYDFITSDRLGMMRDGDGDLVISGVPARANIHLVSFQAGEPLDGLVKGVEWEANIDNKVLVDVDALTSHFGAGIAPRASLATVLLPRISPAVASPNVEVVGDLGRARALIRRNLMEGDDPANTHRHWLEIASGGMPRPADTLDSLLDRVVEQCKVIEFVGQYADYLTWLRQAFGRPS